MALTTEEAAIKGIITRPLTFVEIQSKTSLTEKQTRAAIKSLRAAGLIKAEGFFKDFRYVPASVQPTQPTKKAAK